MRFTQDVLPPRRFLSSLCVLLVMSLTACASAPSPVPPLVPYGPDVLSEAGGAPLVVVVPGALTSVRLFERFVDANAGTDVFAYRLPGFDGRPLDTHLDIEGAAADIERLAAARGAHRVGLVGYSMGGLVVLEAAHRLHEAGHDVSVVAIAAPVPASGSITVNLRNATDLLRAGFVSGSFARDDIWTEYFRVLAFGRRIYADEALGRRATRFIEDFSRAIVFPDLKLLAAHGGDSVFWRPRWVDRPLPFPTLFIHGGEDPVSPIGRITRLAERTGAALSVVPDGAHLLTLTHPEVFARASAFLEGH